MKVKDIFEAFLPRDGAISERDADNEVRVVVHAPGSLGGTPSVGLSERGIQVGFDWDNGKLLLNPEVPLTRLTPEDVAAIHESVKEGQSWHAYEAHRVARENHLSKSP
ncbi:MAG: pmgU domain protein [Caudoviricetes sp.]|nr:MAG: pmgU domain protein [Caudoviricetes sp.]